MAKGKPVELATGSFANQKEAKDFFKAMLNGYTPKERVSDEDALHLASLLERHTEYDQKVGCGVDHFKVMMTEHGTQCFWVIRTDGSGTDFSYTHCIEGRAPALKQEVAQAFRQAVRLDLFKARDKFFAEHKGADGMVACGKTGERIAPDDGNMDHMPPMTFEVIVTTFLKGRRLRLEDVPLSKATDDQVATTLTDDALSDAFRQYHVGVARLEFVKKQVNLAQSSRNRLKSGRIKVTGAD
ncbi:MAG: DCL family protein [Pseudomonadota bacterium]